ncbi:DUF1572 family protein [Planococcus lenghuensis]|nr:DUF1572 family protein [Planococcus lenghuensis]
MAVISQQFKHFKERAEKGITQLSEEELHWRPGQESDSITILI